MRSICTRRALCALAGLLVATLALAGCTHYKSPGERLRLSVMHYNGAIRWQQWKAAARYVPPAKRSEFIDRKEAQQENMRITEFEVRDVSHDDTTDPPTAAVTIEFVWHRYPSLTLQHTRVRQKWTLYGDEDWILDGQEEVEMPAEPETAAEMF